MKRITLFIACLLTISCGKKAEAPSAATCLAFQDMATIHQRGQVTYFVTVSNLCDAGVRSEVTFSLRDRADVSFEEVTHIITLRPNQKRRITNTVPVFADQGQDLFLGVAAIQ